MYGNTSTFEGTHTRVLNRSPNPVEFRNHRIGIIKEGDHRTGRQYTREPALERVG
jgi:hypothetical protein